MMRDKWVYIVIGILIAAFVSIIIGVILYPPEFEPVTIENNGDDNDYDDWYWQWYMNPANPSSPVSPINPVWDW